MSRPRSRSVGVEPAYQAPTGPLFSSPPPKPPPAAPPPPPDLLEIGGKLADASVMQVSAYRQIRDIYQLLLVRMGQLAEALAIASANHDWPNAIELLGEVNKCHGSLLSRATQLRTLLFVPRFKKGGRHV